MEWNAASYHKVAAPQTSWGQKVLARAGLQGDERVIDAGCGSGRMTGELLEQLPRGRCLAVDRSRNMLVTARANLRPRFAGRVDFVQVSLPDLPVSGWADVVFSTATFHWIRDHASLFRNLLAALRPGGRLVAQCGGGPNLVRARTLAAEVMARAPFQPYFAGWQGPWEYASAEATAERLTAAGFLAVDAGLEETPTTLASEADYREFVTTVIFHPHLHRLPSPALKQQFIDEITARAAMADPPFSLDYWRLNMSARRPA